ncbi:hypothetical protein [Clostridium hydrogenum]|uniref:hypothetical protein n=1 Tax=Clostridium hydrogenum TaxID=2855764 RepID=UPI001F3A1B10|nr:hypothetical protein [Clostridium hydrogenum]
MKIQAFFSGIKNSNKVVSKLKSEGIDAYTDINDHYDINAENRSMTKNFLTSPSNSNLVLNSASPSTGRDDRSPLSAASPMVSGMGGFEEIADVNYKVIVNVDPSNKKKAEEIIKELGGEIKNPNFNVPKHVKGIDLSKADPDFMKKL